MQRGRLFAAMLTFYAGVMLWVGGLMTFAVVAGIPFEVLSRDTAGVVNRLMLGRLHILEVAGAVLLGVSLWLSNVRIRGWRWRIGPVMLIVMLTLFGIYAGLLEPMMGAIARAVSFDTPTAETAAAIARFEGYHRLHSLLVGATGVIGLALLCWQTWLWVRLVEIPVAVASGGQAAPPQQES